MSTKASVNLFCLIARDSPVAVVIRRGPAKRVQLLKWDLSNDRFESGQWFKGRIYERYCDLSPSGRYFVYWAGNFKSPYYHWTAVSRPPYLTALSLWPNHGSVGGGLFVSDNQLLLTYLSKPKTMGKSLPAGFEFALWTGEYGSPLGHVTEARLVRGGWKERQKGVLQVNERHEKAHRLFTEWCKKERASKFLPGDFEAIPTPPDFAKGEMRQMFNPANIWHKQCGPYLLEMQTLGLGQVEGPPCVAEFSVVGANSQEIVFDLGRADWADWDANGDLLYAKSGCIFRMQPQDLATGAAVKLIDLTDATFQTLAAPAEFKQW